MPINISSRTGKLRPTCWIALQGVWSSPRSATAGSLCSARAWFRLSVPALFCGFCQQQGVRRGAKRCGAAPRPAPQPGQSCAGREAASLPRVCAGLPQSSAAVFALQWMEGVAVIFPSFRNCVRPGVKNKDGPGRRQSRGEPAVENKSQCSLWKHRVQSWGWPLLPFPWASLQVSNAGFSSTAAAFALWSPLHRDAKRFGQMQKFLPLFWCAASTTPEASLVFALWGL